MRFPWEVEENVVIAASYVVMAAAERSRLRRQARAFLAETARTLYRKAEETY